MKPFKVVITTPEKIIYEGFSISLIAPCQNGYLGVWADHAPLAANLKAGVITLKKEAGEDFVYKFSGKGFLQVLNNEVTLLLN